MPVMHETMTREEVQDLVQEFTPEQLTKFREEFKKACGSYPPADVVTFIEHVWYQREWIQPVLDAICATTDRVILKAPG